MKKRVVRYLKHISITILIVAVIAVVFGLYHGASASYGHHPLRLKFEGDGPYVFYKNDSMLTVNYIKGNKNEGFYLDKTAYNIEEFIPATSFFAKDSSHFEFNIQTEIKVPESSYNDGEKILAISDIESGYETFRDFLLNHGVIDKNYNWIFGRGHLVLVGDFVDRGFSTTQVLWFVYKLEQEAAKHNGKVHFIIGNHELKNMYGDYGSAALKYTFVASILGKNQSNLYDNNAVLGRWLASKNTIEFVNGYLFAHGGLHPKVAELDMSLAEMNSFLRETYYKAPFPKANADEKDILLSSKTGICWYRGYFKEELSQQDVEKPLEKFNAKGIIVGHTLQSKVKTHYNGKVIAIDVKHPNDYHKSWPKQKSEGLFIKGGKLYRALANGEKTGF